MTSILDEIAAYKKSWVAGRKQAVSEQALLNKAGRYTPLDFVEAIRSRVWTKSNAVIAEVKKASPSKGVIRKDFDPVNIALAYEHGGATCLSVLTDERYFQGSDRFLCDIRQSVRLPILRKDFMLDPYQVLEARALGADAVLLIMAMIDDVLAGELCQTAHEQGLAVLPEVHNRNELDRALQLDTSLIGINNRDLHSFHTDISTTLELLPSVPENRTVITESGIATKEDVLRMNQAGVYAFLIGESLMRQPDPGQALKKLLTIP